MMLIVECYLQNGDLDIVHLGRELLRQGDFIFNSATRSGSVVQLPAAWNRAVTWADLVVPGP